MGFGFDWGRVMASAAYGKGWKALRRRVLDRDGWRCLYCGADLRAPGARPSVDHIIPVVDLVSAGENVTPGAIHIDDLASCCASCNSSRGARMKGRRREARRVIEKSRPTRTSGSVWDE